MSQLLYSTPQFSFHTLRAAGCAVIRFSDNESLFIPSICEGKARECIDDFLSLPASLRDFEFNNWCSLMFQEAGK